MLVQKARLVGGLHQGRIDFGKLAQEIIGACDAGGERDISTGNAVAHHTSGTLEGAGDRLRVSQHGLALRRAGGVGGEGTYILEILIDGGLDVSVIGERIGDARQRSGLRGGSGTGGIGVA